MKKSLKILFSIFLIILWLGVIFCFSNQNTKKSNYQSKNIITNTIQITISFTNKIGIINKELTQEELEEIVATLNKPIRKCAHFTIYLILAILLMSFFIHNKKIPNKTLLTIILCFLYAITDEYHQTFITGRTGQFSDVLIDTAGAIIGTKLYKKHYVKLRKKKKAKKTQSRDFTTLHFY